ncbi:MAG: asparaginase [Stackebrandtia sp.]
MTKAYRGGELLAEAVRSGFVESLHRGSVVVLGPDERVVAQAGDVEAAMFPRSSTKPMQTLGALRTGLIYDDPADLAIASASHHGEPFHVARVRSLLLRAGLTPEALQCPASLPVDEAARDAIVSAGGGATRLLMNCSGKHAAMLAACVAAGHPADGYLDPEHPLQQANRRAVAELSGYTPSAVGVDGCGAPLFAYPLRGLARAFLRLVQAAPGSRERAVADAMRDWPQLVSGTRGQDTKLMLAVPGLLSKGGAEGVAALAAPGVGAVAVKIDDGAIRASYPVAVSALRALDLSKLDVDERALGELAVTPVLGGGEPVGAVRTVWPARPA